jgi:predicted ribonuclease YlaK
MPIRPARPKSGKKLFVLDTTVSLHDSDCLRHFQENDLVLSITVLRVMVR